MTKHEIVSGEQWIEARRALLAEEKAWTRERDRLPEKRRTLPWVNLDVYSWLDLMPQGRNETRKGNLMDWARRHERYEDDGRILPATAAAKRGERR